MLIWSIHSCCLPQPFCHKKFMGTCSSIEMLKGVHDQSKFDNTCPDNSFTYVSDTHGTCSWLEHVVSSKSAHDSIQNVEILHQSILSDHRPVAATIKTVAIPQNLLCDNKTQHEKNMNWNKATQQQKLKYQQASKIWLSKIPLFEELM